MRPLRLQTPVGRNFLLDSVASTTVGRELCAYGDESAYNAKQAVN